MEELIEQGKEIVKGKVKSEAWKLLGKILAAVGAPFLIFVGIGLVTVVASMIVVQHADNQMEERVKLNDIPSNVLQDILQVACDAHIKNRQVGFAELIAYEAAVLDGDWEKHNDSIIWDAAKALKDGSKNLEDLLDEEGKERYQLLCNIYNSVFAEFVGSYCVEQDNGRSEKKYGVKAFYPIPSGYSYQHYDDYGDERTYQGESVHEGNDIIADKKVPIVAVEGGTVENLGWNEWGGYRVGIRSFDGKRYYYYAHMFKEHPYNEGLRKGNTVDAGAVIGFVGDTGYSPVEGTSGLFPSHLHIQIEVNYSEDGEDQKVWINPYAALKFLEANRKAVLKKGTDPEFGYTRDESY